jgi:hypothetical protein
MKHLSCYELFESRYAQSAAQLIPVKDAETLALLFASLFSPYSEATFLIKKKDLFKYEFPGFEETPIIIGNTDSFASDNTAGSYVSNTIRINTGLSGTDVNSIVTTLNHEMVHYWQDQKKILLSSDQIEERKRRLGPVQAYVGSKNELQANIGELYRYFEKIIKFPGKKEYYQKLVLRGDLDAIFLEEQDPPVPSSITQAYNSYLNPNEMEDFIKKSYPKLRRSFIQTLIRLLDEQNIEEEMGGKISVSPWVVNTIQRNDLKRDRDPKLTWEVLKDLVSIDNSLDA